MTMCSTNRGSYHMAAVMSPAGLFIFEDQMLHATVIRSITEGGFPSNGLSGGGGGGGAV